MNALRRILPPLLFWSWNSIFAVVFVFSLLPYVLVPLVQAAWLGHAQVGFVVNVALLLLLPFGAALVAVTSARVRDHLGAFFYGVECPLLLLLVLRIFVLRELTTGAGFALATFLLAVGAHGYELLCGPERRTWSGGGAQLAAQTIVLLVSAWAAAILLLYALPFGVASGAAIFSFDWVHPAFELLTDPRGTALFFLFFVVPLFIATASLFIAAPPFIIALALRSWGRVWRTAAVRLGRRASFAFSVVTAALLVIAFVLACRQPQTAAFALLENPPADAEALRARLEQSESIRAGLLNAYLASDRYVGAASGDDAVRGLWTSTLRAPQALADAAQRFHTALLAPFFYLDSGVGSAPRQSTLKEESDRAQRLYESYFDTPIQKGDREAVLHAITSTYQVQQAEAGLLHVGEEKVWLAQQEIAVQEHGDWAEIELHEVYRNQTLEPQEMVMFFSLPETAVITGLWIGEGPDREQRLPAIVAPRGAAQRVYRAEVQRRRDPALVEQVGPRQYRLRAFPILAKPDRWNDGAPFHLWLTYAVMGRDGWPTPRLAEKRNLFWNARTQRSLRGEALPLSTWMPASIPYSEASKPTPHTVALAEGAVVEAVPSDRIAAAIPDGARIAVVLDRSRSMRAQADAVERSLAELRDATRGASQVDLYLTSAKIRGESPKVVPMRNASSADLLYEGALTAADLLGQFAALRGDRRYDVLFVLTDATALDLSAPKAEIPPISAPLWMIHLGGTLPPQYDDAITEAVQSSRGGVATDLREALAGWSSALGSATSFDAPTGSRLIDGYQWSVRAGDARPSSDTAFAAIAAHQLIATRTRQGSDVAELDALQAIAVEQRIVSPYSSMIVLVDAAQRAALEREMDSASRFERPFESGEERLRNWAPFRLSATPEPETWMLLAITAAMLLYAAEMRLTLRFRR